MLAVKVPLTLLLADLQILSLPFSGDASRVAPRARRGAAGAVSGPLSPVVLHAPSATKPARAILPSRGEDEGVIRIPVRGRGTAVDGVLQGIQCSFAGLGTSFCEIGRASCREREAI